MARAIAALKEREGARNYLGLLLERPYFFILSTDRRWHVCNVTGESRTLTFRTFQNRRRKRAPKGGSAGELHGHAAQLPDAPGHSPASWRKHELITAKRFALTSRSNSRSISRIARRMITTARSPRDVSQI